MRARRSVIKFYHNGHFDGKWDKIDAFVPFDAKTSLDVADKETAYNESLTAKVTAEWKTTEKCLKEEDEEVEIADTWTSTEK